MTGVVHHERVGTMAMKVVVAVVQLHTSFVEVPQPYCFELAARSKVS